MSSPKRVANRDVPALIRNGYDADGYGSLWGRVSHGESYQALNYGHLPQALSNVLFSRRQHIDAVIYSYGTPIAWRDSGEWIIPAVRYSTTTAKHQGYLGRGLRIPRDISLSEYLRVIEGKTLFAQRTVRRNGSVDLYVNAWEPNCTVPGPNYVIGE